jgi:hypothetical protein
MTKEVVLGERVYTVRELTVLEIRNWIGGLDANSVDVVDEMLLEGVPLSIVREAAGIARDEMDGLVPSEVEKLKDAVKAANPHFLAMIGRVMVASRQTVRA